MSNGFKDHEVVRVQGKEFPVIGGRLRIVHEVNKEKLSIITVIVDYQLDRHAIVRAKVETRVGSFTATGTATAARDPKRVDSLIELAETRAVARALRFAGIGVECCGFEELGAGEALDGHAPRQLRDDHQERERGQIGQKGRENGNGLSIRVTSAQRRAIESLSHRLGIEPDDAVGKIFQGMTLDDLTLSQASQLIDQLRAKAGNGGGNGLVVHERR